MSESEPCSMNAPAFGLWVDGRGRPPLHSHNLRRTSRRGEKINA
jgi:hypothetical protein